MTHHASKKFSSLRIFTILCCQFFVVDVFSQETAVFQWVNTIGTTGTESPRDIAIDANRNIYTSGTLFKTPVDMDPGPGEFLFNQDGAVYISKVDENGSFLWAKEFVTHTSGYLASTALFADPSGNTYLTGEIYGTVDFDPGSGVFELTSLGNDDVFFCKLDPDGNFAFAKLIGSAGADEQPKDIKVDATGNIYLSGSHRGLLDFDPGAGTFTTPIPAGEIGTFYCKYDPSGNLVWAKTIHYPGISGYTNWPGGESIVLDATGNIYSCGAFRQTMDFDPGVATFNLSSNGGNEEDAYILKFDNNGGFLWAKNFGNAGDESTTSIDLDGSGGVYITGLYGGTVDFDPGAGVNDLGGGRLYVSKFDVSGNYYWTRTFGGSYMLTPMLMSDDANVYVTGAFALGPQDFDPGSGTFNLDAEVYDTFTTKLTDDGDFVWAVSYGSPTDFETPGGTVMDDIGNVYTIGSFGGTSDFDPGSCVYNVVGKGGPDAFTIKLKQATSISAPTITSFAPSVGPIGSAVTITGTNFSATPASNAVKFFNNKTATVTASTTTSLTVTVPTGTVTGKISVTVNCLTATSATDFVVGAAIIPTITGFAPSSGPVGTLVTISGTNFSTTAANNTVEINGVATTVTASTSTSITTTIPVGATTGKFKVTVGGNTTTSANNFTVTQPSGNTNDPPNIEPTTLSVAENGVAQVSLVELISDPDGNEDLSSLFVSSQPISGAPATIEGSTLIVDYTNIEFKGTDRLEITVCDTEGECADEELTILVGDVEVADFLVYNAVSPNGDGKNDILYLQAVDVVEELKENQVTIFNRWGDVVFEVTNYDNATNVFKGLNKNGVELPSGNYHYRISFPKASKKVTGYISIRR